MEPRAGAKLKGWYNKFPPATCCPCLGSGEDKKGRGRKGTGAVIRMTMAIPWPCLVINHDESVKL